jgi:hypothetical protein
VAVNHITGNTYSDEWYTDSETVWTAISILQPKQGSVILCPFDSDKSEFVKELKGRGFTVLHGMQNFLSDTKFHCDYIMTNPPFSIKDKVIEKVYEYGVPTLLILPLDSLGGVKRTTMYQKHGKPFVVIPPRRISFYDENYVKREGSSFHSVYMVFNDNREGLEWLL